MLMETERSVNETCIDDCMFSCHNVQNNIFNNPLSRIAMIRQVKMVIFC